MPNQLLYVHALSPIHIGAGQGEGVIDLPVVREATTGWPYLPGTGVKGVLRDACRENGVSPEDIVEAFGPETDKADEGAGGVIFPDVHLLCLPVRSARGTFAWVTSMLAVNRWLRDAGEQAALLPDGKTDVAAGTILLPSTSAKQRLQCGTEVRLEDLAFTPQVETTKWALGLFERIAKACFDDSFWHDFFLERVGIISDDSFTYFTRTALEITAHNRIDDDRKIVAKGQLWWEEAVPAEAIFAGLLDLTRRKQSALIDIVRKGIDAPLQMGGNASVGRGIVHVRMPG